MLTNASAGIKTENTMSVFYNIIFHNNKRQHWAKTTVWTHLVSCVQLVYTTVITFVARIMSIFKDTADISELDLEWLDFCQSGGLSCEVIHTEGCILHGGGHRSVGGAHPGPHIVFLEVPLHSLRRKECLAPKILNYQRYDHKTNGNV